ncbi:leucine-rich repeat flightless-interacting protein 1 isoform X14 [Pseudonaja textilis]|uniref:leucine-rich repeat flightless-interacting protein 1 isoform X14 n=1 Tax=Pseudonaja textilis TaxID=8673 RepID=UPI000EAA0C79|nr:leucine-rich repeat flightless-interacting protein 1 isoform X14 [Pseudonaja textilis]
MENAGTMPQGIAGRKRIPNRERPTAEDEALNLIAREGEARLAAKRAARAEAREIRMKELEKQQKEIYQVQKKYYGLCTKFSDIEQWMEDSEHYSHKSRNASVSDEDDHVSVHSRGSLRVEERSEKDFEKGIRSASSLSAATVASLGGTSSRRGSGDTSISIDTEASIREIKNISELKDEIENVEAKYMQGLKQMKDSSAEVEEKYKKAMVSNAQLDNEKTNFMYQVETLQDALLELEEQLAESKRQFEEKSKDFEREKHAHSILQFQFTELKEALKQKEELLAQYGIITNLEVATNGEISERVTKDGLSNSSNVVSETSHVIKSEDCTEGRANEVEMENEILENMGKREMLQNTEHEENTEDTKDQEINLKCLEIKTLPADENIETNKVTEAKITSTLKLNSGLEDPVKSYSECIPEIVDSLEKRYSDELKVEGASPSHILEEKLSDRDINVTHNQNNMTDPSIEINQEIHANLEIVPQQQNKEKQTDIVVDESEGNSEVFWEALDFINSGHMAISTSPELVDVVLMKASSIDLNSEQSKNGVVERDLNRECFKNEQNPNINVVTKGPKIEMCETNEENEAQSTMLQQEDQVVDSEEEQKRTCIMKVTLNEFGEEQDQLKVEEIQSPPSKHDAVADKQNEQELGANKENVEDTKALNAYLDFEGKNNECIAEDVHAEQPVVDYINQSKCQTQEETNADIENDSSCNVKSACIDGALADIDMINKEVAGGHKEDLSVGKQSVDKEDNAIQFAVTTTTMKEGTEETCTRSKEGKNCKQLHEEIHSIVPDIEEVGCLESQKTEFIEQNEPENEEIIVEEYHEALDVDAASFGEFKTSEKRDDLNNKDNEKIKASLLNEIGSEAFVEESDSIQQLKGHKSEEVKSVQMDFSVSETTKSPCGQLEEESKLLDEISSVQIADYTPKQLENLESAMNENQEETERYNKKGKGKSREDCIIS